MCYYTIRTQTSCWKCANVYCGICIQNPGRQTGSVEQMAKVHIRLKAGVWRDSSLLHFSGNDSSTLGAPGKAFLLRYTAVLIYIYFKWSGSQCRGFLHSACRSFHTICLREGAIVLKSVTFLYVIIISNHYVVFSDCTSGGLCVHCPGVQSYCSPIWKVSKSGSGSKHVWRTVYLHQVRYCMNIFFNHLFLIIR